MDFKINFLIIQPGVKIFIDIFILDIKNYLFDASKTSSVYN